MKKEISGSEVVYIIAIFCLPIITFIGLSFLFTAINGISDIIQVGQTDYASVCFKEMISFSICWVALFISYLFHKFGIKLAQLVLIVASVVYLVNNCILSTITYISIAELVNPIVIISTCVYAIVKPLPQETTKSRKERMKNSLKNYKPTAKKNKDK